MLDALCIAPGNSIELPLAQGRRVQLNAALGPAEGQVQQRGSSRSSAWPGPALRPRRPEGGISVPPCRAPRAPLCCTRYPCSTSIRPSSMRTGSDTLTSSPGLLQHSTSSGVQAQPRGGGIEVTHHIVLGAALFTWSTHASRSLRQTLALRLTLRPSAARRAYGPSFRFSMNSIECSYRERYPAAGKKFDMRKASRSGRGRRSRLPSTDDAPSSYGLCCPA